MTDDTFDKIQAGVRQLSLDLSRKARDSNLKKVKRSPWMEDAIRMFKILVREGETLTGEEIRIRLSERIDPPHHHNAWGALIMNLRRQELLEPTGHWVQMRDVKSHGRATQLLRRVA